MKQRLGVALSVLFISGACLMMGMVGAWAGPIAVRQDVAVAGSKGISRHAGVPAEGVAERAASQTTAHGTGLATDDFQLDGDLDPWLPIVVALLSGVIVVRISCLRQDVR